MSNTASLTTFAARFKTGRNSSAPAFLFISNSDRILLTKRLALILRSGMPLTESLLVLQSESRSRSLTYILSSIIRDVALGKTLSNALSKFPRQFNPFLTQIIAMGEASGTLSENLDFLSLELLRRARIKRMVLGALAYPLLILSVTIGVTVLLTVSIFPKVMPIFQSLHGTLPLTTRLLISTSLFLKDDGIALASVLIALILASVVIIKKVPRAKRWWLPASAATRRRGAISCVFPRPGAPTRA